MATGFQEEDDDFDVAVSNPLSHIAFGKAASVASATATDGAEPTTLRNATVAGMEKQQMRILDEAGDPLFAKCKVDWCLVMRMDKANPDDLPPEVLDVCTRLFDAGLCVRHHIGVKRDSIFLQVGATSEMMMHEATYHMVLNMRVKGPVPARGMIPFHHDLTVHFATAGKVFRFSSGHRQRIVMNLIHRKANIDPDAKVMAPPREKLLSKAKSKAEEKGCGMQRWAMKELLEANGVSGEHGPSSCVQMYRSILEEDAKEIQAQGCTNQGTRVDVSAQRAVIEELEQHKRTSFEGNMVCCFPLHDLLELNVLTDRWANWALMYQWTMSGEGMDFETKAAFAMFWQPVDMVREYFGDHVALYYAWLGLYTRWLRYPAVLGTLVMLGNFAEGGIDENPLVLSYSIFLSLWSTLFVEVWRNRENKYKFTWGSEGFEMNEKPRPQFRGAVREDKLTGVQVLVHEDKWNRWGKITISSAVSVVLIVVTIFGAYFAYIIRNIYPIMEESCLNMTLNVAPNFAVCEAERYVGIRCSNTDELIDSCVSKHCGEGARLPFPSGTCVTLTRCPGAYDTKGHLDLAGANNVERKATCEAVCPGGYTPFKIGDKEEEPTFLNKRYWKTISSVVNLVLIQGGGQVYERVAGRLNKWENHRTQTEYVDALILKAFGFQFVNNFFTLFYIAFLIHFEIIKGMVTGCEMGSCMGVLQNQLLIVFSAKTVVKKIVELMKPYLKAFVRSFAASREGRRQQAAQDVLDRFDKNAFAFLEEEEVGGGKFKVPCERERWLDPYGNDLFPGTFDDFKDMTIQFGYVTLFAASFPLAALFAMLSNIFEIRSDAFLLCRAHQRPRWEVQEDIGSWTTVLVAVSIINTMVNAMLTGFVGSQLSCTADTLVDNSCSVVEVPDHNGDGEIGFMDRIYSAKLWMIVVLIEHSVLCCKVVAKVFVPDEPEWVAGARESLSYRQDNDLLPATVRQIREANEAAFNSGTSREAQIAKILRLYKKADEDSSGDLGKEEFRHLLESINADNGLELTEDDVANIWHEIDTNNDGNLSYAEVEAWWLGQERKTALAAQQVERLATEQATARNEKEARKEAPREVGRGAKGGSVDHEWEGSLGNSSADRGLDNRPYRKAVSWSDLDMAAAEGDRGNPSDDGKEGTADVESSLSCGKVGPPQPEPEPYTAPGPDALPYDPDADRTHAEPAPEVARPAEPALAVDNFVPVLERRQFKALVHVVQIARPSLTYEYL